MQEELLFDIELNNEGRSHILRLFRRVRFVFIAAVAWSGISLLTGISGIITALRFLPGAGNWMTTRLIVVYSFTLLNVIIIPLQTYYYYGFARQARESIDDQDTMKFNRSFGLLSTNALIVAISVVLNIAFLLFNILYGFLSVGRNF
jgi:hypothetical protein